MIRTPAGFTSYSRTITAPETAHLVLLMFNHPEGGPSPVESLESRGMAKPRCGICQFRLSTGKQPSSVSENEYTVSDCEDEAAGLLPDLQVSAHRGCTSCRNILNFFLRQGAVKAEIRRPAARWLEIRITRSDKTFQDFVFMTDPTFSPDELSRIYPPLGRGLRAAEIKSTADNQTLDQARHWWEICSREHHCQVGPCSYIPRRLLRLKYTADDAATVVSLVEDLTEPVEYVALSHRWSEETKAVSLLTSNRRQMLDNGLLSSDLPCLSMYIAVSTVRITHC